LDHFVDERIQLLLDLLSIRSGQLHIILEFRLGTATAKCRNCTVFKVECNHWAGRRRKNGTAILSGGVKSGGRQIANIFDAERSTSFMVLVVVEHDFKNRLHTE